MLAVSMLTRGGGGGGGGGGGTGGGLADVAMSTGGSVDGAVEIDVPFVRYA
jgi:hypothetical protein